MSEKFERNRWSRSPKLKVVQNLGFKIVLKFQKRNCSEVERATNSSFRDK